MNRALVQRKGVCDGAEIATRYRESEGRVREGRRKRFSCLHSSNLLHLVQQMKPYRSLHSHPRRVSPFHPYDYPIDEFCLSRLEISVLFSLFAKAECESERMCRHTSLPLSLSSHSQS